MGPGKPVVGVVLTPPGEGGIGVLQVVGTDAVKVLELVFRGKSDGPPGGPWTPGELRLGRLMDGKDVLDEAMVCVLPGDPPAVEIQCHGGQETIRRILRCLEAQGVKLVKPPEWLSLSACRMGLDRIQCEAAEAIPWARSELALSLLLAQHEGALSGFVRDLAGGRVGKAEVEALLRRPRWGEVLCCPRRAVLAGPPNAGKSSLFNRLLKEDRVITAESPGTTRDAIAEEVLVRGVPVVLVDTAGLRETEHPVEKLAIEVSVRELAQADLVLFVFDASLPLDEAVLGNYRSVCGRVPQVIPVLNKMDLAGAAARSEGKALLGQRVVEVSALAGTGLDALAERVRAAITPPHEYEPGAPAIFTDRQASSLERYRVASGLPAADFERLRGEIFAELLGRCPD
ncbi:MAG: 50S ribosome-binding GTPase [Planctomycetes bacterium]|nr:50S ribosome-binding GTPase [Planctomycetota bacterium]